MWDEPKFVDAPYLAITLYVKALSYAANAKTDGFVPSTKARELVKRASHRAFTNALDHLTTTQPGCVNPSWEHRAGGWYIHDYDDPQYANTLREDTVQAARARQLAGKVGGLKSAAARRAKYGTAQPKRSDDAATPSSPTEANPEAPSRSATEAPFETASKHSPEANPEAPSKLPTSPGPSFPLPSTKKASKEATSVVRAVLTDAIQNGHTDDLATQLAIRVSTDVLKRGLSPLEVTMCDQILQEFAYLGVDDAVERMQGQLQWAKEQKPPLDPPTTLGWFLKSLRIENDHRADAGRPKAWRPEPIAGDLRKLVATERDPDE